MSALITITVLALILLYLGLYRASKALLPVAILGLITALVLSLMEWDTNAVPIFSDMMLYDHFAVAFSGITIFSTILILALSKDYFERISSNTLIPWFTI